MSQPLTSTNLDYDLPISIWKYLIRVSFKFAHEPTLKSLIHYLRSKPFLTSHLPTPHVELQLQLLPSSDIVWQGRILRQAGTQLHSFCPSHPHTDIGESDNPTSMRAVQHQESLQFSRERGFSCNFNYNTLTPWWSIQFKKQAFPKLKTAVTDCFPAYYCCLQISLTKTSNCITEIQCRGHTTLDGRRWPHIWQQAWLTMSQQLSCNTG